MPGYGKSVACHLKITTVSRFWRELARDRKHINHSSTFSDSEDLIHATSTHVPRLPPFIRFSVQAKRMNRP